MSDVALLELAVQRGLLSSEEMHSVTSENSSGACDLAIRRNLLTAADVDLLRPLSLPSSFIPDYEFIELIGEGAMGAVYKARQLKLDRLVALKLLKRSALENQIATSRSQIEARVGARLRHPSIVSVYDYGVRDGQVFLAMEFVEGRSLLDMIDQQGRLESRVALAILKQVVSALAHAAEHDVVHRDIKPANLLVTDKVPGLPLPPGVPAVLLADFGLASQMPDKGQTRLTVDGTTVGTPCYAAPEQMMSSDVDLRADIYALGASLFHMVQGQPPYFGENAFAAIAGKMQGKEEWRNSIADDIPFAVRQLILDMTNHSRLHRIQNYGALTERIEMAISSIESTRTADSGETTVTIPVVSETRSPGFRLPRFLATTGALVLLFIIGTAVWQKRAVPEEAPVERGGLHALFNGVSTPQGPQDGQWYPVTNEEAGYVLAGSNGWKSLEFPAFKTSDTTFFEFHVDVNPPRNTAADVCFAFRAADGCSIVRVTQDRVTLGRGQLEDGSFIAGREFEDLVRKSESDSYSPVRIAIHRQADNWFIYVNGKELGTVIGTSDNLPRVALRVDSGTANFSDIEVRETRPARPE